MSDPTPRVEWDYELHFANGAKDYLHLVEGRDVAQTAGETLTFTVNHDDGAMERIEVYRRELASVKAVRREILPASTIQDAGRLKVVGPATVQ